MNLVGHPHWLRRPNLAQADRSNGGEAVTGKNRADHAGEMMAVSNRFEQLVERLVGPEWQSPRVGHRPCRVLGQRHCRPADGAAS